MLLLPEEWTLVKSKNGIQVYQRGVENSKTPAFKGVTDINSSSEAVFQALKAMEKYVDWLPMVKSLKIVEQAGNKAITYVIIDAPWPLTDRDGYFEYLFDESAKTVRVTSLPKYKSESKDLVRIGKSTSKWSIEKKAEGKVRVNYESHTELQNNIPQWLVRSKLISVPFNSLEGLIQQLKN